MSQYALLLNLLKLGTFEHIQGFSKMVNGFPCYLKRIPRGYFFDFVSDIGWEGKAIKIGQELVFFLKLRQKNKNCRE